MSCFRRYLALLCFSFLAGSFSLWATSRVFAGDPSFDALFQKVRRSHLDQEAVEALNTLIRKKKKLLKKLFGKLYSKNTFDITASCKVIEFLGPEAKRAIPKLRRLLKHPHYSVVFQAAKALGKMQRFGRVAVPDLVRLLRKDRHFFMLDGAIQGLAELGPHAKAAAPKLLRFYRAFSKKSMMRSQLLGALIRTQLPPKQLFPLVDEFLKENQSSCEAKAVILDGFLVYTSRTERYHELLAGSSSWKNCPRNRTMALSFLKKRSNGHPPISYFLQEFRAAPPHDSLDRPPQAGAEMEDVLLAEKLRSPKLRRRLVQILAKKLRSPTSDERFVAIAGFGVLGKDAKPYLKELYALYQRDFRLRGRILLTMRALAPYAASWVPLLDKYLAQFVRRRGFADLEALFLLKELGKVGRPLRKYVTLNLQQNERIKAAGLIALLGIGATVKDIPALEKELKRTAPSVFAFAAATTLRGKAAPLMPLLKKHFWAAYREKYGNRKEYYLYYVGQLGPLAKPFLPVLLKELQRGEHQRNVLWTLEQMGYPTNRSALSIVRHLVQTSKNKRLVWMAERFLKKYGKKRGR